jgi:hypothetical protein
MAEKTSTQKGAEKGITKMEAVRIALAELGEDAKPAKLQPWIKEHLGIGMSPEHITTCKGTILRKAGGKRKSKGKKKPPSAPIAAAPAAPPAPARAAARNGADTFSLQDLEAVQTLIGRVGAEQLRKLIDVLAR